MCVAAIGLIGGAISAVGSVMAGMQQAAAMRANAQAQQFQAQAESAAGSFAGRQKQTEINAVTGKQITAIAANGLDLSGSPLNLIEDTRTQGELDKAMVRANWQNRSNLSSYQGRIDNMNAGFAETGGILGGIGAMIGPIGSAIAPTLGMSGGYTGIAGAY